MLLSNPKHSLRNLTKHLPEQLSARSNEKAYTSIELLICVSILALLSSIAIPSFAGLVSNNRVSIAANDVLLSLVQARNYAITHNKTVLVCQIDGDNDQQCSSKRRANTNWSNGWLSYVDKNENNELDDEDSIISVTTANEGTTVIFNQRGRLRFFADGSARSAGFYICQQHSDQARHIRLLYTGRARISQQLSLKHKATCESKSAL